MTDINNEQNITTVETKARRLMVNHQRALKNRQQTVFSRSAAELGIANDIS